MRRYIATITESKISRTYGGATETANIYRIKNNKPVFITSCHWCTRGYRGDIHEVMNALCNVKELPMKYKGYYDRNNGKFEITMI